MSYRLNIPQVLLNTVREAGYPPLEEILLHAISLINMDIKRVSMELWIPDGPRAVSLYRTPNDRMHFDIEGCYSFINIKEDEVTVELLPVELMSALRKLPVREFHKQLRSL